MTKPSLSGKNLAALSFIISGALFFLYPAIRPFSDEASLQGALAFASPSWILAHSLAMAGFILLALGILGVWCTIRETTAGPLGILAVVVTWIGVGLTLPYYGAETFGLYAVGKEAVISDNVDLFLTLTQAIRYGPGMWFFLAGLLGLAAGTVLLAIAIKRSGILPWWSGIPLAAAFILFLPQFFFPQPVRVAHGLLVMAGCWLVAWSLRRKKEEIGESV